MDVTRHLGTYSQSYWLMYLMAAVTAAILVGGILLHVQRWRLGHGTLRDRLEHPWRRVLGLAADIATHRRFRHSGNPWLFHALFIWGFAVFLLGTACLMLQENFGLPTFQGEWYLFLKFGLDLFAILVLAGVLLASWRRWVRRPFELTRSRGDGLLLAFLGTLPVTGLLLEGVRMALDRDPWASWSPVGHWLAGWFSALDAGALASLHQGLWWGHLLLSFGFLAAIPFTRFFHLIAAPAALFFADPLSAHSLAPLDFSDEEAEAFGVGRIEDFHWKRLLDAEACVGCGRCQVQCPAWQSGKELSPKEVGEALRTCLTAHSPGISHDSGREGEKLPLPLAGGVIQEDAIWACTTCRACETHCPAGVEHVSRMVDMRRFLVLTEARFPAELQTAFRGLERSGNPWGLEKGNPVVTDLRAMEDASGADVLLWPGCAGIYDPRYRKVTAALAALLKQAGVRFAVPGEEVVCCGDSARRLGNEYLFQELAQRNIAALEKMGIQRIVTSCPHCLNTLNNEYRQFDGNFQAVHHSVLIRDLLAERRLNPTGIQISSIAYHDPCYLGRYAGEVEAPRAVLAAVTGQLKEFRRQKDQSFCCGGGGGRIWLEETLEKSVRRERAREGIEIGADTLATACPFCLTMLSDALKEEGRDDIRVMDLAEIAALVCLKAEGEGTSGETPVNAKEF